MVIQDSPTRKIPAVGSVSVARGLREVAYFDCAGGGQVFVDRSVAYIGHLGGPEGTTIVDVSDPKHPRRLAELRVPPATQSHKVRVADGIMLVNWEAPPPFDTPPGFRGGLAVWDVSRPDRPREITFWQSGGAGVHRFDWDGRYAYISPEVEGYHGNIVMILDLADPAHPSEVGRWWMPGQWTAGGETPTWPGRQHRCHHCLRLGDRLYVSYLHGGFVILDISDLSRPRFVSGLDWSPPYPHMIHTALPIPFPVRGRRLLVVPDEDVLKLWPSPPAFMWVVDITDETRPMPISTFQVDGVDETPQPGVHRLPPDGRAGRDGDRAACCLVHPRPARRGHRQPARPARGRLLRPAGAAGRRPPVNQRCLRGRPRAPLRRGPSPRHAHPGAGVTVR